MMGFVRLMWWRGKTDGVLSKQNLPYFKAVNLLDTFLLLGTQRTFPNQISRFSSCFCTLKVNGMWRHGVWIFAHMQYLRRNAAEVDKSRAIQFRAAARRIFGVASRFLENLCIPAPMDGFFKFHFISGQ
jgi:hypothetical protein